jgi:hypothetical protein
MGKLRGVRRYRDEVEPLLQLNEDVRTVRSMPVVEQDALIAGRQPTPGVGFEESGKRAQILAQAVRRVRTEHVRPFFFRMHCPARRNPFSVPTGPR